MNGISSYDRFLALHKVQLISSGVPEHYWPTLCEKLEHQIFNSDTAFNLMKIDYGDEYRSRYDPRWTLMSLCNIETSDPRHIYLVDHVWTFKPNHIKKDLEEKPGLFDRICVLMQILANDSIEEAYEIIYDDIWRFAQTYNFAGPTVSVEDHVPRWYLLDELGASIAHSEHPNFRIVPFYHIPEQLTYTLLFPITDIPESEIITRDFVEGTTDPNQREAMLIPWQRCRSYFGDYKQSEPDLSYFTDGHIVESLPHLESLSSVIRGTSSVKLKVYSEYRYVNEYLTSSDFEIVDNENEADILWYLNHFKDFKELSVNTPYKFINQYPFEYVVTVKDLLAIVGRRCDNIDNAKVNDLETYPLWLPTTYNLKTELLKLVKYYRERKKIGLNNHWICKPYNLARGLDTYITDNLDFLCRLPASGPKIAQKYIENPVLFNRPDIGLVKFDIRYVILLTSVEPTEVYVYTNFFLRFSNKPFGLNNFGDYEQHFTVMNYNEEAPLYRLMCHEFKEAWGKQYPEYDWKVTEKTIFNMFTELFEAATIKEPPCGIAKSPQSRALYAADLMLSWRNVDNVNIIQPKLLEVNWMPDCQRACEYYPNFYNDIFNVMFLNKDVDSCIKI